MKTTWVMQTNMGEQSDIQEYVTAVKESGANVIEVQYIPFSEDLPEFKVDGPIVLYGAVNFIKKCEERGIFTDGIFGNSDTFTYEAWAKNYGDMLLNSPDSIKLTTIEGFLTLYESIEEELVFVRPQHDTKSLVGRVWYKKEFFNWCKEAATNKYPEVSSTTEIVIGTPYGIEAEWRLFIVNEKIVGASQYHQRGRLNKAIGAPQDVLDFASKVLEKWNPAPSYTLDVCRSAGNCYIVEVQGFNSAGHYASDIKKVAEEVNKVAMDIWLKKSVKTIKI